MRGRDLWPFLCPSRVQAIDTFLDNNDFDCIIRAHEVKQQGIRFCKQARVLTVFTSSAYCGTGNGAGAVFIARETMRMISVAMGATGVLNGVPHNGHPRFL